MNWLAWAVLGFLALSLLDGYRKGFVKKLVSMVALIITILLVYFLSPFVGDFLKNHTPAYDVLKETCAGIFELEDTEDRKAAQVMAIEATNLPDQMKQLLIENNNGEVYDLLEVSGFGEYAGAYLAKMILNAISFVVTFILVSIGMAILMLSLDIITKLPVLHGVNKLAGMALGLAQGLIVIWIASLAVTIFCGAEVGQKIFALITESQFLSFLYAHNYFLDIITALIVK